MKGSQFLITKNNPDVLSCEDWFRTLCEVTKVRYGNAQLEKGKEGTVHIQAYLNYKNPIRVTAIQKYDKQLHIEIVKEDRGASRYCLKEDTRVEGPWEYGERPVQRNKKEDWDEVRQLAQAGKLDEIPADIYVKHYNNLKKIERDHMKVQDKDHLRGIWVYGEAGSGKSRWAREQGEDIYPKLCNKWWDGYKGQKIVVMDDVGLDHKCLGQQLKIWTDRYGCILENKGGAVVDNYNWLIVTSQYHIDEIWEDKETREALKRRFHIYHVAALKGLNLKIMSKMSIGDNLGNGEIE